MQKLLPRQKGLKGFLKSPEQPNNIQKCSDTDLSHLIVRRGRRYMVQSDLKDSVIIANFRKVIVAFLWS